MTGLCVPSPKSCTNAMLARSGPRSALVGAISRVQDIVALDFALRGARVNDHTAGEIRAGVTFAFGVTKGPDILSRLSLSVLHGPH